jgi:hypothetical protein
MKKHNKQRGYVKNIYQHGYKLIRDKEDTLACVYCGLPAGKLDYYPPLTQVTNYERLKPQTEIYIKVHCCTECNSLLSNTLQDDFEERIEFLKDCLAKKYKRVFICVDRLNEAEAKGQLKNYLIQHGRRQQRILDRLNYNKGLKIYRDYILTKGVY